MEDPDWIEVAFLFEQEPAVEMYESLLAAVPQSPGPEYGAEEFQLSYQRPGDHAAQIEHLDLPKVIEIMPSAEYCSIEVPMEGFNLA
jgi:hypothetical protein